MFTGVVMGLWHVRTRHHVTGRFCYGRYGSHNFYGSYDWGVTGSAAIFKEAMARMGQEAPPFLLLVRMW